MVREEADLMFFLSSAVLIEFVGIKVKTLHVNFVPKKGTSVLMADYGFLKQLGNLWEWCKQSSNCAGFSLRNPTP